MKEKATEEMREGTKRGGHKDGEIDREGGRGGRGGGGDNRDREKRREREIDTQRGSLKFQHTLDVFCPISLGTLFLHNFQPPLHRLRSPCRLSLSIESSKPAS